MEPVQPALEQSRVLLGQHAIEEEFARWLREYHLTDRVTSSIRFTRSTLVYGQSENLLSATRVAATARHAPSRKAPAVSFATL